MATLLSSGCGDYLETLAGSNGAKKLGTVSLPSQQTYTSCRSLCRANYPDFEFYEKFVNYQSCDCYKMDIGFKIETSKHGAYTFGYANDCSKAFELVLMPNKIFIFRTQVFMVIQPGLFLLRKDA